MTTDDMTGLMLSAYAVWGTCNRDHDDLMKCFRIEENLSIGIHLFRHLMEMESSVLDRAAKTSEGEIERALADGIDRLRAWIEPSRRFAAEASAMSEKGYEIRRLDEFRALLEEAICIVENSELEADLPPMAELAKLVSPGNPDPARYGDY